jgi:hypothetical protein
MKNKVQVLIIITIFTSLFFAYPLPDGGWTKTELYFGLSKPDGGTVTNEEFNAFSDSVIAKTFYEGFTVISSKGSWYDYEKKQTISEESKIVVYFCKMNDEKSAEIDTVRAKYKRYFNQQAVLRSDQKAEVDF